MLERINRAYGEMTDLILDKLSEDLRRTPSVLETQVAIQNIDFSNVTFESSGSGFFTCYLRAKSRGIIVNSMTNTMTNSVNTSTVSNNHPYFLSTDASGHLLNCFGVDVGSNSTTTMAAQTAPTQYHSNLTFDSSIFLEAAEKFSIADGTEVTIDLPNGAVLEVKADGSIKITDVDSKVTYKACGVREFNRFINASDLLQDFIKFLGTKGVKQGQVLDIPVELFINWLVFKAAEQDEDLPPENMTPTESHPKLLSAKKKKMPPKCLCCGKFIKKDLAEKGFNFCSGNHASKFATEKLAIAG